MTALGSHSPDRSNLRFLHPLAKRWGIVALSWPRTFDWAQTIFRWLSWHARADKVLAGVESSLQPSESIAPLIRSVPEEGSADAEEEHRGGDPLGQMDIAAGEEDQTLLQQVMRLRDSEGREYIYATLRGEFAAGQRGTSVYVGFCPPFLLLPRVEAEVIEGPPSSAQVVQVQNHGAQIDLQLETACSEPTYVIVEVAAFQSPS